MRQQLTDTATLMFMERGFDAIRVAEVAAACGVSEKTVFNYFPTKESLILDRLEGTMAGLRAALADSGADPVEAMPGGAGRRAHRHDVLAGGRRRPRAGAAAAMRGFGALI